MTDFLALHVKGRPLLQPNAWDAGSARILAAAREVINAALD